MILDSPFISGSMSFGIANPSATMHISASTGAVLRVDGAGVTNTGSLFVSSSGNVGIGTTNPSSKLQILGTYRTLNVVSTNDQVAASFGSSGYAVSTIGFYGIGSANDYNVRIGANVDAFVAYTNDTERLRITSNGNVGIGVTSPTAKLHISGSNTDAILQITSPASASILVVSGSGRIGLGNTNPATTLAIQTTDSAISVGQTVYNYNNTPIGLQIASWGANYTNAAGIKFHRWTGTATDYVVSYVGNAIYSGQIGLDFRINSTSSFNDATSSRMFISSGGNVGIGNTSPNARLDVSGSAIISGSINATGPITGSSFTTTGTITAQTLVVQTVTSSVSFITGSTKFGSLAANTHQFTGSVLISGSSTALNVNNGAFFISSSGQVGIGTSTPSAKLHLYDGTNPLTLKIQRTSVPVYFSDVQTGGTIAGAAWSHNMENTSNGSLSWGSFNNAGYAGAAILLNSANSTSSISFYTANNVNTNPSQSMHLNGAGNLQLGTVLNSGAATATPITMGFGSTFGNNPIGTNFKIRLYEDTSPNRFGFGVSNALLEIIAGNSSAIAMFTNASERMRISSTGLVGIGTDNPTSPLTIKSTSRGDMLRLSISGSSAVSDATGITFGSATYDKAQIIAYNENTGNAAGYLTFWTGGSPATTDVTERIRITSAGQVYVGGTSMGNGQRFGIIGDGVWDGATLGLQNTGTSGQTYTIFSTNSSFSQGAGNLLFYNNNTPSNVLIINSNGNYDFLGSDVSDRRLKQDIENVNFGLNEIMQLSPKSYHLKSQDNLSGENITTLRKRYGFIAQEVQTILPDTITGTETETEYLGLDYNGVLAVAVKAIQELKAEIDELKNK